MANCQKLRAGPPLTSESPPSICRKTWTWRRTRLHREGRVKDLDSSSSCILLPAEGRLRWEPHVWICSCNIHKRSKTRSGLVLIETTWRKYAELYILPCLCSVYIWEEWANSTSVFLRQNTQFHNINNPVPSNFNLEWKDEKLEMKWRRCRDRWLAKTHVTSKFYCLDHRCQTCRGGPVRLVRSPSLLADKRLVDFF